ncbi:MAG TPA: hypothetical protein VMQ65_09950 [Candidatus Limnocylindria bacterium]|nr:hypothetical protein [Candidatus Limnocylindria bacterium]
MFEPEGGGSDPAEDTVRRPSAPTPESPAWAKAYELPTARKVVGAGLHLAATSSAAIRRASLYIGLLVLGAFGPTAVLMLVGIGRLLSDPATVEALAEDPVRVFQEHPEIVEPLLAIYFLVMVGILLLVTISIDAQAIAIAVLGGIASDRPLRLWEAVVRARQVFWRLAGAGFLVGLASAVVAFAVSIPLLRPLDTNTGITFIASMVGALVVTPFAFAATGIVLGDVGAIESLQRSMSLFRARPSIAFVVVLFTLVTSAIQSFALGAGLDVAVRVAEFLGLGLDGGGAAIVLPAVLILGLITAFGSLTFTVAAIVAAPQVAAFLGLTFYSAGLDRARSDGSARQRGFRWVTLPMVAFMAGLAIVALLQLPAIAALDLAP